jgi:hypothetical protein
MIKETYCTDKRDLSQRPGTLIKETYCRALAHLGGIEEERSVKRDPITQEKRPVTLINAT